MDKVFIPGLYFKKPSEKAPSFIIGSLSAKKQELIDFLAHQEGDWVNMVIKESKGGKQYIELDTWKPEEKEPENVPVIGDDGVEVPF